MIFFVDDVEIPHTYQMDESSNLPFSKNIFKVALQD